MLTATGEACFLCPIPASPLRDNIAGTLEPGEAWVVIVSAARGSQTLITSGCETNRHDADERGWRFAVERYRIGHYRIGGQSWAG